ncbi:hypothetical protein SAMN05216347_101556 [Streptococcus equinus]|uniref:Uncharacterized protein n=1 Tax=Streptococcus equinus TaxID=1335 RepID=A0A1H0KYN0_STREI|nr:hypothetical protein [Streptococcus equinus]SDO61048.1 hypothetical protein SAMN05216347_101556 [Streptococcus equinus]
MVTRYSLITILLIIVVGVAGLAFLVLERQTPPKKDLKETKKVSKTKD